MCGREVSCRALLCVRVFATQYLRSAGLRSFPSKWYRFQPVWEDSPEQCRREVCAAPDGGMRFISPPSYLPLWHVACSVHIELQIYSIA